MQKEYTVIIAQREDTVEQGIVVAKNEKEAKIKLEHLQLVNPKLEEIKGIPGILKRLTADVK